MLSRSRWHVTSCDKSTLGSHHVTQICSGAAGEHWLRRRHNRRVGWSAVRGGRNRASHPARELPWARSVSAIRSGDAVARLAKPAMSSVTTSCRQSITGLLDRENRRDGFPSIRADGHSNRLFAGDRLTVPADVTPSTNGPFVTGSTNRVGSLRRGRHRASPVNRRYAVPAVVVHSEERQTHPDEAGPHGRPRPG